CKQSGGLPARVNALAAALFGGDVNLLDARHGLPRAHRAIAMLVLAFVISGWLSWTSYRDRPQSLSHPISATTAATAETGRVMQNVAADASAPSAVGADMPATTGSDAPQPVVERVTDTTALAPSVTPVAPLPHDGNVPSPMNQPLPVVQADSAPVEK